MSQFTSMKDFQDAKFAELEMYGCDYDDFQESAFKSMTVKSGGLGFLVVSILSDVQEMVSRGLNEQARQHLNLVKRLMIENKVGIKSNG